MGGAGFLGSNLSKVLLDNNFEVFCLDNLSTGSTTNIHQLINHPNFTFIEHDVRNKFSFNCDWIVNLASPASPFRYQLNPVGTLTTNFQGTLNGLELARETGAKFLQASTSEIYGDPAVHPQVENYWGNVNPIGVRSCYDEGKRAAESLFFDYQRQYDIDIRVARIFNTYGPRMAFDDGRVVSNFIIQALKNQDITIYGDGLQTRSFCFVDDLITGIRKLMEYEESGLNPVNLGNPIEITMLTLANNVIQLTKSNSKIVYESLPSDDPKMRKPDIRKAMEILSWSPEIDLHTGLVRTIEDFIKRLQDEE